MPSAPEADLADRVRLPDRRLGVTQRRQAELIGQSGRRAHKTPRVDMLIHYLVKDEPNTERFQSGLFNVRPREAGGAASRSRSPRRARRRCSSWGRQAEVGRADVPRPGAHGWRLALQRRRAPDRHAGSSAPRWPLGPARACGSPRPATTRTAPRSAFCRGWRHSAGRPTSSIGAGMRAKGLIAAGGRRRLGELTRVVNKHLLPVGGWPMIYYPLQLLQLCGVLEVLIVTGQGHAGQVIDLLGDGRIAHRGNSTPLFDLDLTYKVQVEAGDRAGRRHGRELRGDDDRSSVSATTSSSTPRRTRSACSSRAMTVQPSS